jgi:hypothetical protein
MIEVTPVKLVGHGLTDDGGQAVLGFRDAAGIKVYLGLAPEDLQTLAAALAALSQDLGRRHGDDALAETATPIQSWSTVRRKGSAMISLTVLGGLELRFLVTPDTVDESRRAVPARAPSQEPAPPEKPAAPEGSTAAGGPNPGHAPASTVEASAPAEAAPETSETGTA